MSGEEAGETKPLGEQQSGSDAWNTEKTYSSGSHFDGLRVLVLEMIRSGRKEMSILRLLSVRSSREDRKMQSAWWSHQVALDRFVCGFTVLVNH